MSPINFSKLWSYLNNLNIHDIPWLLCGDLNYIISLEDELGGHPFFFLNALIFFVSKLY